MPSAVINDNWYYVITEDELTWLAEKVVKLHAFTERVCKKEIEGIGARKNSNPRRQQ